MTDFVNRPALDPNKAFAMLEDASEQWADAFGEAKQLEEAKKPFLAKLANDSGEKSVAAQERWALAHPDYAEFLSGLVDAQTRELRARLHYKNLQVLAELRRTEESTRRALTR